MSDGNEVWVSKRPGGPRLITITPTVGAADDVVVRVLYLHSGRHGEIRVSTLREKYRRPAAEDDEQ